MKTQILKVLAISLIISTSQNVFAGGDQSWLMKMVYQPSQYVLDREERGFVNIYDGFTDTQVDEVLDRKFERIGHMMFTRIKTTGTSGAVLKDSQTGKDVVEDDGCD